MTKHWLQIWRGLNLKKRGYSFFKVVNLDKKATNIATLPIDGELIKFRIGTSLGETVYHACENSRYFTKSERVCAEYMGAHLERPTNTGPNLVYERLG